MRACLGVGAVVLVAALALLIIVRGDRSSQTVQPLATPKFGSEPGSFEDEQLEAPSVEGAQNPRDAVDGHSVDPTGTETSLSEEYKELLASFPSIEQVVRELPDPLPKVPVEGTPYIERHEDGKILLWTGDLDLDGQREGPWVCYTPGGVATKVMFYKSGMIVPPVVNLHANGKIKAYYPNLDELGGAQGVGWWWFSDGQPRAAITWKGSKQSGPAVFLTPEGLLDGDKTRFYSPTE